MKSPRFIQNNEDFKEAFTTLYYFDPITEEDAENLYNQIMNYLKSKTPAQLAPVHDIIREMFLTSKDQFLGELTVETGIARAENLAYLNGVADGTEPYFQNHDEPDYTETEVTEVTVPMFPDNRNEEEELPF